MDQPRFDDSLRTGFDNIDEQHALFLVMLAELTSQIEAGNYRQGVLDAFQGMRLYAEGHFVDEEQVMQKLGYPELPAHKRLHETFRIMVADLEGRISEEPGLLSLQTLEFLRAWFVGHIRTEDLHFAAFARSGEGAAP